MIPNRIGTCRGSNRVPNVRPRAAAVSRANGVRVSRMSQLTWMCTGVAGTTAAIGNTSNAANRPLSMPAVILPSATSEMGSGASTRSSISFVYPNSCTRGSATDWMP